MMSSYWFLYFISLYFIDLGLISQQFLLIIRSCSLHHRIHITATKQRFKNQNSSKIKLVSALEMSQTDNSGSSFVVKNWPIKKQEKNVPRERWENFKQPTTELNVKFTN